MTDRDEEVELDTGIIAVGGTRPAMVPGLGLPLKDTAYFILAFGWTMLFKTVLMIPVGLFFLGMLKLYARDYNAGRVMVCFLRTNTRHLSPALGGTYLTPGRYRNHYVGVPE